MSFFEGFAVVPGFVDGMPFEFRLRATRNIETARTRTATARKMAFFLGRRNHLMGQTPPSVQDGLQTGRLQRRDPQPPSVPRRPALRRTWGRMYDCRRCIRVW